MRAPVCERAEQIFNNRAESRTPLQLLVLTQLYYSSYIISKSKKYPKPHRYFELTEVPYNKTFGENLNPISSNGC